MDLNKFHLLLNKKILILGSSIIVIILLIIIFTPNKKPQNIKSDPAQPVTTYVALQPLSPTPTNSAELEQAIEEAKQSAREYDDWQANLRLTYPWLRKLPVADTKYYVYFDLKEEKFLGSIYPARGDNVAIIKTEALRVLKEVKEIPVDDYQFTWTVK
ncbi:hypothetical protein A3D03_06575 [Candidatus Gottesmanbacteria bacterium RIFCSPHIGHO2_02_FULL_40_13]|uniref:Uncharacterized protein n=1 Tax=Candidatus Gottesmanbacteria bacterium RIFCSPHIGHO2_02_FULL_40_13 TaxID=1798384 RepID=A0A1F6AA63_9BACT|nr:MAG: hypothetical protein A3D03_06575 [Candidatus Gottesmanbacteria bacterium RIFCSPHIGHO2_02_FULL_40_13]